MLKRFADAYNSYCDWYWRTRATNLKSPWLTFVLAVLISLVFCITVAAQLTHQLEVNLKTLVLDGILVASAAVSWFQWRDSLRSDTSGDDAE